MELKHTLNITHETFEIVKKQSKAQNKKIYEIVLEAMREYNAHHPTQEDVDKMQAEKQNN